MAGQRAKLVGTNNEDTPTVRSWKLHLRPSGEIKTMWTPEMGEHGTVKSVEPNKEFSFTWEGDFSPAPTLLTFELEPENGGTLLKFTHSDIGEGPGWEAYAGMEKGWDAHLSDLTSWVESGSCPPPGPRG